MLRCVLKMLRYPFKLKTHVSRRSCAAFLYQYSAYRNVNIACIDCCVIQSIYLEIQRVLLILCVFLIIVSRHTVLLTCERIHTRRGFGGGGMLAPVQIPCKIKKIPSLKRKSSFESFFCILTLGGCYGVDGSFIHESVATSRSSSFQVHQSILGTFS